MQNSGHVEGIWKQGGHHQGSTPKKCPNYTYNINNIFAMNHSLKTLKNMGFREFLFG
jgi:hypothetical protein